jgi:hypothetical protein
LSDAAWGDCRGARTKHGRKPRRRRFTDDRVAGGGDSRATTSSPLARLRGIIIGNEARLSAVLNVHRPERLGLGFLPAVVLQARVHNQMVVVLQPLVAQSDDVPLRAGPCISDMMSFKPACSLLARASRRGRSRLPTPLTCFERSPLERPSEFSPQRRSRARQRRQSSATSNEVPAPDRAAMNMSCVPACSRRHSSSPSNVLPARARTPVHARALASPACFAKRPRSPCRCL